MESQGESTPDHLREGVASGILASIEQDVERRGGSTARRLVGAGVLGVVGTLGVMHLVLGHPMGHHPTWHASAVAVIWSGILIVSLAAYFLQIRTPSLPLAEAAGIGVLGLGLAGICGAACSNQHFLVWWADTQVGARLSGELGPALSASCFGLVVTIFIGAVAALVFTLSNRGRPIRPVLAALALFLLLAPGIALQSYDVSWGVFWLWLLGTAVGAYVGIALGTRVGRPVR
ncbi:MAG TPA: hypothetical protein ENI85_18975 [Deltaproteobacteria bacterium]|nr:hypothetical protein [Deltaproteobacteria bacterium]